MTHSNYTLYVNEERTIKVEVWPAVGEDRLGSNRPVCLVATREHPGDVWGPPVRCDEEETR